MISRTQHHDVTQLAMSSRRSRMVGYGVAAYLVRGVLIDTGFPRIGRAVGRLVDELRPRGALVTHQHEDHAGNVALLARRGVPLGMGALTRTIVERPITIELYRRAIWGTAPPLRSAVAEFADDALRLLPTPGHTADHHAVWDAERGTLFTGDLFLGVKVRVAHRDERPRETLASLRRMIALAPARLFCAHRGPVRDAVAALTAKAEWMAETIGQIEERIAQGWSDAAIRREVLDGESGIGYLTGLEYARVNFVRAVRRERMEEN